MKLYKFKVYPKLIFASKMPQVFLSSGIAYVCGIVVGLYMFPLCDKYTQGC